MSRTDLVRCGVTNDELRDQVLRDLEPLPVAARRLFGGYGLYLEDAFFAVIADGHLYFRTDDVTRPDYTRRGMQAFQPKNRPRGPKTVDRNFEVPADIRADARQLQAWAMRASQIRDGRS